MNEEIRRMNLNDEFYTDERCYITELSNSDSDPSVSIARARVEPNVTTRWHRVNAIAERYVILKGKALVEVGDLQPQEVSPGDVVLIPPSCRQRITNLGEDDLVFLAICSPRFQQEAYQDIED
jgi:mannose-6-phosphate isomerase-like protein (cupin superfamily)